MIAALDSVAANLDRAGNDVAQLFAGCNAELRLYEIDTGDHLRHRMLDLDARVHFDEVQLAVFIHQKLDGAGVHIADVFQALFQRRADLFAHLRRDLQRRRFLDHLLMAALDGALALAQRKNVAVLIGEDLKFDVAWALDKLLHVEVAVAEGILRFCAGGAEKIRQLFRACEQCACRARRRLRKP